MKALIIDSVHTILNEKLNMAGITCDYLPKIEKRKVFEIIADYEILILRSKLIVNKALIDIAKKLKIIGRVGAGMENIDTEYAQRIGIKCINSPEGNRNAVGEHCLGMLLSLSNKFKKSNTEIKAGIWEREKNRGFELANKTIGIIGYGNMGSAFAEKLKGFNCKILSYDKYKNNYGNNLVKESSLEELFEEADVLSLHVPLTDETEFMVENNFINRFKKKIVLLNTARGKVVKTADLVDSLKTGKIIAVGLDVLEYEDYSFENFFSKELPDDFKYLCNQDNVILTPHIAGWTIESKVKLSEVIADKIIAYLSV